MTIIRTLGGRLLLAYLTVMAVVLGASASAVYLFFVSSLYQQVDNRLLTLAQSAALNLTSIKLEGDQHLDNREEIPWQDLFRRNRQSLSWFDAEGQVLATQGSIQVKLPPRPGILTLQREQIRTYTITVYSRHPDAEQKLELEGYIRASESIAEIEEIVNWLRWGFGVGGVVALGLIGIGGTWLVNESLRPTRQSLDQLKQFTADASHELRSPLTAIKTSIDVILKHPERIHPKDIKKLTAIASATNQMTRLVEDLLFLARANPAGSAFPIVEKKPILLDKLLQELVTLLEPQAQERNVALKTNLVSGLFLMGDSAKINRLFSNLLENALQYTPAQGVVTLSMMRIGKFILVNVEDTGCGIAPDQLNLIFQRFWRADRARSHRSGGLGLGLAIAQAIAQQHEGEISVSSQVGVGSCFRVRLPLYEH
ncbi:MAG: HAMP domain-containing histidine kinase [Oculatellaceae cyanobacterium Prado106]|jgi:signal transduction histidine kinase|nr:HAMP domain-containing histidine kinase [Oculatellaceae cyanobacterium Prado106]